MLTTLGFLMVLGLAAAEEPRLVLSANTPQPYVGQEIVLTLDIFLPKSAEAKLSGQDGDKPRLHVPWLQADFDWAETIEAWANRNCRKADTPALIVEPAPMPIHPERIPSPDASKVEPWDHYRLTWRLAAPAADDINQGRLRFAPARLSWKTWEVTSNAVQLVLRPVPPDLAVSSRIQLGVGDFTLRAVLDSTSIRLGEAVRLTLRVSGRGPLWRISPPSPRELASALPPSLFAVQPDGQEWLPERSERCFHYKLIVRSSNVSELPRIPYNCFDPDRETWRHRSTAPVPLTVLVPPDRSDSAVPGLVTGPVPERLRFDLLDESDLHPSTLWKPDWFAVAAWIIPPMAWLTLWLFRRRNDRRAVLWGSSFAARHALQELEEQRPTDASDLARIVLQYLGVRFALKTAEPSADEIRDHLQRFGLPVEVAEEAARWWQSLVVLRFVQTSQEDDALDARLASLRAQARSVIETLEKYCP
ncbi:MAG: hypothetical protein NZM31_01385 [Gemmatales bacterium]|nr:hypothetical protein [Gemmatales bacterium]MDW8385649.1 hypothetical protein [Gemmatales bacterium]